MTDVPVLLDGMIDLALEAGAKVMDVYARDFDVAHKDDRSPVTEADKLGEAVILAGLAKLAPGIPVLAEEAASEGRIPELGETFFLVDPLDGTKEFISRNGEFTVNIALIENGRPVAGVVYAPALSKLYSGSSAGGAFLQKIAPGTARASAAAPEPICARPCPDTDLVAVASRSHRTPETDAFLTDCKASSFTAAGSSLKFCLLAEGAADVYPRLGRTMEWDTGAGQAVLEAAGGKVCVLGADAPLTYCKRTRGFDNPHFVAWGAPGA